MQTDDSVIQPPSGTVLLVRLEPNMRNEGGTVGRCLSKPWTGAVVFFKNNGVGLSIGAVYSVYVNKSHLRVGGGYILARALAEIKPAELGSAVASYGDYTEQLVDDPTVRLAKVPIDAPGVSVKIGGVSRVIRKGAFYFFPFGRKHDRFAMCEWPIEASELVVLDDVVGYQEVFKRVNSAMSRGMSVWWPEKWEDKKSSS